MVLSRLRVHSTRQKRSHSINLAYHDSPRDELGDAGGKVGQFAAWLLEIGLGVGTVEYRVSSICAPSRGVFAVNGRSRKTNIQMCNATMISSLVAEACGLDPTST